MNQKVENFEPKIETIDFPWGTITWHVSRSLANSEQMTFGRVRIKAGMSNPRHQHPNCDEILHLLSGRLEHSLGEKHFMMVPGQTISIPTGIVHNATALGTEDAEMIICFSSADRETVGE